MNLEGDKYRDAGGYDTVKNGSQFLPAVLSNERYLPNQGRSEIVRKRHF